MSQRKVRETKRMGGLVTEAKIRTINGVEVGEISGHIAAWSIDRGFIPDRFVRGAWLKSIQEHVDRNNRQVRFKDHHGRTVGGYPIDGVREDSIGLFGTAHVNLEVQQGREAFSLARQKVLVDKSVGFIARDFDMDGGIRVISEAELLEGSIVDEPMNVDAQIQEVKNMNFDIAIAPGDYVWDEKAAEERIQEMPFRIGNGEDAYVGTEVKFLVGDVIDGKLMIVPAAMKSAAEQLHESENADPAAIQQVERYLAKMSLASPFDEAKRRFFGVDDVKAWTIRDLEQAMVKSGSFSNGAAKLIVKKFSESSQEGSNASGLASILEDLRGVASSLKG